MKELSDNKSDVGSKTYRVIANYEVHFRTDVVASSEKEAESMVHESMSDWGLERLEIDEYNREYDVVYSMEIA